MIGFDFNKHCCGCAACVDICNQHCITMIENKNGFRIPQVDASLCVGCGMCDKVCPVLNVRRQENCEQRCYGAYNLDEKQRYAGSSGSMFYLIADWVLNEGGVVFGAAFDEHLHLRHTIAKNQEELIPLMKSKYLQSDTTGIFSQVKSYLREDKMVLFVGTPCQCQALSNSITPKMRTRLILVDFICHGVPSQHLFNRFIKNYERKHNATVTKFFFRHKPDQSSGSEEDVHHFKICYQGKSGKICEDAGFYTECSFYFGFKMYQIFRNSCYECKFVGKDRITDFTLGDFWHLTEYETDTNDFYKGYSEIIVNSNKGNTIFEKLKCKCWWKEFSMDLPIKKNPAYQKPTTKLLSHDIFFTLYNFLPYRILSVTWSNRIVSRVLRKLLYILNDAFIN